MGLFDDPDLEKMAKKYNDVNDEDIANARKLKKPELEKMAAELQPMLDKLQKCKSFKNTSEQYIADIVKSQDFIDNCKSIISHDFQKVKDITITENIVLQFRNLFQILYVLEKNQNVLDESLKAYNMYYDRLKNAITSVEYMSDGFMWMFAPKIVKQNVKDGYQAMLEFKQSGAYDLVNKNFDVLFNNNTAISDTALVSAFSHYESDWRNHILQIIGDNAIESKYCHYTKKLVFSFNHFMNQTFDDTVFDDEIEKYRHYVEQCIIDETTKDIVVDIYQELEKLSINELNNDKSGIRISTLESNGFHTLADIYRAPIQSIASIKGISTDTAYKIKFKVDEVVNLLRSQKKTETDSLVLNFDKRTKHTSHIVYSIYNFRKFLIVRNRFNKMGELDFETIERAVNTVSHFENDVIWLFMNEKKRKNIVTAFQYLHKQVNSEQYKNYVWFFRYRFEGSNKATVNDAWNDFRNNSVGYYNSIEFLVPNAFENASDGYGLPEDLAEQIEAQIIYPNGLNCELRRYQVWGVKYILHQGRALLGDEMGLGKTIQAIATMVSLRNVGFNHFLVICPASVIVNWYKEIRQHSKLQAYIGHGTARVRDDNVNAWKYNGGVLITTYETYANLKIDNFEDIGLVTVDEAHYIKNPEANRSKRVRELCHNVERVLFLTGTAIENNVTEMISLLSVLNEDATNQASAYTSLATSQQFKDAIAPVYFRRKQSDVNKELPEKIEIIDWCEMNDIELRAYDDAALNSSNPFMPMRRVSWNVPNVLQDSTKANKLREIVAEAVADNRKVIVFSFFKDTIRAVQHLFIGHCSDAIDGSLSPAKRQDIIDDFSSNPSMYVLVSQIQAGGTGLNIQAASVVVMCEPQIKPSIENQAIARAHRMGQSRNVIVHRLCSEDTIDERMLEILDRKKEQFEVFADRSVSGDKSLDLDDSEIKSVIADEISRIKKRNGVKDTNSFKDSVEGQEWNEADKETNQLHYTKMANRERVRTVTASQRYRILTRDNFTCQKCGRYGPGAKDENGNPKPEPVGGFAILEVDHKTPFSLGGSDDDSNLWTLCDKCNGGKSNDYDDGDELKSSQSNGQQFLTDDGQHNDLNVINYKGCIGESFL